MAPPPTPPNSPTDEAHLIAKAAAGDDDALGVLLERHAAGIRAEIAGKIPARWQSVLSPDDVVQETFLDAFLDIGRFAPKGAAGIRPGTGLGAWLASIARCNLVDALRMLEADKRGGDRKRVDGGGIPDEEASLVGLLDMLSGSVTTASVRARRSETAAALRQAVAELDDPHRRVVELYDLQGRAAGETAAAIGRSEGAMFMLRARAHRQLAETMGAPADYLSRRA